jgi:hypothetical protein
MAAHVRVAAAVRRAPHGAPIARQFRATPAARGGGGGPEFDPKTPGMVSLVMDNWVGFSKTGPRIRDGWYWWDPSGAGAVSAGLASQIVTAKSVACVGIAGVVVLIERWLDYRDAKHHDEVRHPRRHGHH